MNWLKRFFTDTLSWIGLLLLAIFIFGAIAGILITGFEWISNFLVLWFARLSGVALIVSILILFPLSFFVRFKQPVSTTLFYFSYIFGATLWMYSLLITEELWGNTAVFIGLILMGMGTLPFAIIASLFHGEWLTLSALVLLWLLMIGARFWCGILMVQLEDYHLDKYKVIPENPEAPESTERTMEKAVAESKRRMKEVGW